MTEDRTLLVRRAFAANAVYSFLTGLVLLVDAGPLAEAFGLPGAWLAAGFGVFLIGFGLVLGAVARSRPFLTTPALLLTVADGGYVLASFALAALPQVLTPAGRVATVGVAVGVLACVIAQALGLRRAAAEVGNLR
jgi:hypothetical protein